jgi:ketosteroid isomerase-like protein
VNETIEVEQVEKKLRNAMLSSDVETLDGLLSDEIVFTNQDGQRLSKADDLAAHRSGLLSIDRLEPRAEPTIRVIGDSAIVTVTVDLAGTYDGQPFGGAFAYSRMWHRHRDKWRIEAAHCSSVAGT